MNKNQLRKLFLKKRSSLQEERRLQAETEANKQKIEGIVASYSAIKAELNLSQLNLCLAKEKRLALPRVENGSLAFYLVCNLDQLICSSWNILEPDPDQAPYLNFSKIKTMFVPALVFDHQGYRLGYGKGFYDNVLSKNSNIYSIGIGFEEQLINKIPTSSHDTPLKEVRLY